MKNIKILFVLLTIIFMGNFAFANGQQEVLANENKLSQSENNNEKPDWLIENTQDYITVLDSFNNEVTIKKPVNVIVDTAMGQAISTIKALNAESKIKGISTYVSRKSTQYPTISKLPVVTSGMDCVDNELIIQLNPDFILTNPTTYSSFNEAITRTVPILQIAFNSTDSYRMIALIMDKENEADEYINWIKSYTDIIDTRIANLSKEDYQDVFIYYGGEYGFSSPPPYGTFGKDNFLRNELIKRAGGTSITQNLPGEWITVDPEWIIEQNPPLIIRECFIINDNPELGYDINSDVDAKKLLSNIMKEQPAFKYSDAIKNNNVHLIYGDLTEDSWFISLVYIAKWLHPDLFSDLDPISMHQEYLTRFQNIDFDLREKGLFTYSSNKGEI